MLCLFVNSKCSKILNTFLFLFSNKMWVNKAGIHKMHVRIANRGDPGETASDLGLHCLSIPFWKQIVFEILEHLPYLCTFHNYSFLSMC